MRDACTARTARTTGIHYLHVRSIVSQNHGRAAVTIQIQEWESDSCQQSLTHSACDSQLSQKYPYSNTVTARPVERARAHEWKKAVKKALTGIDGVGALRANTCSAHISG